MRKLDTNLGSLKKKTDVYMMVQVSYGPQKTRISALLSVPIAIELIREWNRHGVPVHSTVIRKMEYTQDMASISYSTSDIDALPLPTMMPMDKGFANGITR